MMRFNIHGVPLVDSVDVEEGDPTIIVTVTAGGDGEAQRLANLICPMDIQEIECAECSMSMEDCRCPQEVTQEQGEAI